MLNIPDALCCARLTVAVGRGEASRSRDLTVLASFKEGHEASKFPRSSPGLPGEGQRLPQPGQDMGIGMEARQGAYCSISKGLHPLLTCSSSKATQMIKQALHHPEQMGIRLSLPRVTDKASPLS